MSGLDLPCDPESTALHSAYDASKPLYFWFSYPVILNAALVLLNSLNIGEVGIFLFEIIFGTSNFTLGWGK